MTVDKVFQLVELENHISDSEIIIDICEKIFTINKHLGENICINANDLALLFKNLIRICKKNDVDIAYYLKVYYGFDLKSPIDIGDLMSKIKRKNINDLYSLREILSTLASLADGLILMKEVQLRKTNLVPKINMLITHNLSYIVSKRMLKEFIDSLETII